MKHYALILGALVDPKRSADSKAIEHRISVYGGTDALYIPISTERHLADVITANFWFRGQAEWARVVPIRSGTGPGYAFDQKARVEFALESLGEFTDEQGIQREIIYFTAGETTTRRILKGNEFGWTYQPSVILAMSTLLQDSDFSRSMTGSGPDRRGAILPVLQEIYKEKGWN